MRVTSNARLERRSRGCSSDPVPPRRRCGRRGHGVRQYHHDRIRYSRTANEVSDPLDPPFPDANEDIPDFAKPPRGLHAQGFDFVSYREPRARELFWDYLRSEEHTSELQSLRHLV